MKSKPRRKRFKVGMRREYFPRSMWQKEFGRSYVETFEVLAHTRSEAASLVWQQHGERLLSLMNPDTSIGGRRVSLEVDSPGRVGSIGRLAPILVHTQASQNASR